MLCCLKKTMKFERYIYNCLLLNIINNLIMSLIYLINLNKEMKKYTYIYIYL